MARTKISEFSATPGNNTDIDGINIAEGCAPSGINDAIRELMAQLKDFQAGTAGDSFNGPVGTTTAAAGAFTTLTTSGAVTHNGGTANGVAYLNGSKVLTTGSALTFDGTTFKAAKAGTPYIYAENTANAQAAAFVAKNTAGSSYLGQDSTGGYIGTDYAAPFLFYINNSEQMRLTSTGLGIGTSSPATRLSVDNTRSDTAGTGWFTYTNAAVTSGKRGMRVDTNNVYWFDYYNGASWSAQMGLDSSGNLGLGVTPSAWATAKAVQIGNRASLFSYNNSTTDVGNNAYFNGSDYKYIETATATFYRQASGAHSWFTAPSGTAGNAISFTQAMTLDASGRLLVGTTTVADSNAMLTVYNPNATSAQICLQNTTTGTGSNGSRILATGNDLYITNKEAGFMAFETNDTERARIDSSGNLLVGTTSQIQSGKFCISYNGNLLNGIVTDDTYASGTTNSNIFRKNGSQVGSISQTTTSTAYNTSSDYRLKESVQPMTGALAKVQALKPCTYKWKADGSDGEGFIAHELAEVVPQCVTGEKDAVDAEGKPVYQGIDTSFLVATLTAAIQEQQAIITDLRARVAAIEAA